MQKNSIRFNDPREVQALETLKNIEQYSIKKHLLGSGHYAQTYIAISSTQEIVACKMINKKQLLDRINNSVNKGYTKDFFTKMIQNEALAWEKLKHPNIAQFKGYKETPNNVYFFLEYCADGTLQRLLSKIVQHNQRLQQSQAIKIFKQIVNGCDYLCDMKIFHRDLKPDNIMFHNGVVKIVDFSFAKLVQDDQAKNNSQQRTSVGTPIYMSPQVLLQKPYNIKCDVWSIGVILYRLLYLILPWQKHNNVQSLIVEIRQPIHYPPSTNVTPLIKQLLMMMLQYNEQQRIQIKTAKIYLQSLDKMELQ